MSTSHNEQISTIIHHLKRLCFFKHRFFLQWRLSSLSPRSFEICNIEWTTIIILYNKTPPLIFVSNCNTVLSDQHSSIFNLQKSPHTLITPIYSLSLCKFRMHVSMRLCSTYFCVFGLFHLQHVFQLYLYFCNDRISCLYAVFNFTYAQYF